MSGATVELFVVGSSHAVTTAEVRERLHVDNEEIFSGVRELLAGRGVLLECVPLVTCGRLELYCVAHDPDRASRLLGRLVAKRAGLPVAEVRGHAYALRGSTAVRHLFRVASGLDSVVYGEAEILGQVRVAAHDPLTERTKGPVLHRLFEHALHTGKKVRTETEVGRGAASLASAAVQLVREEMRTLEDATAIVLGAGHTGGLVATLLAKAGIGRLIVANRTLSVAEELAEALAAEARPLADLPVLLREGDLIVGAALAGEWLVTADMIETEPERTRYFLDLAHPRNIDPAVGTVPGVTLLDLEHVFDRVEAARMARAAEVPIAEAIVKGQAELFMRWFRSRPAVGVLRALREHVIQRATDEADRFARGRGADEREDLRRFAQALARTLLHEPTVALRRADPSKDEGRALLESAQELFHVEPERH